MPVGHTKRCVFSLLQNDVSVSVGFRSDSGKEFHSFGAQAAKLCGPKWKCGRLALADRHERQSVSGDDVY